MPPRRLAALALLGAAGTGPAPSLPRLELTLSAVPPPAWAQPAPPPGVAVPVFEIALTLVNDGDRPVDAPAPMAAIPAITDAAGQRIVFVDMRDIAGFPAPRIPEPPQDPVGRGERRRLATYLIARNERGYQLGGPYGDAQLPPGRYRIRVALDLSPTTRAAWIAAYRAARRTSRDAERQADRYAAHWRAVPTFFAGHLDSNTLEIELP